MKRVMAFVLVLLGLVVIVALRAGASEPAPGEERALDLVIRLEHDAGIGSGLIFRLARGNLLALTARHVVKDATGELTAEVRIWPGRRLPVLTFEQFRDADLDLAIVLVEVPAELRPSLDRLEIERLGVDRAGIERRAAVRAVGHPAFQRWFVSPAVEVQEASAARVKFFHGCERGLSGGGLFDANWNLVGMVRSKISQNLCEALPVATLLDHLRREWELEPAWKVGKQEAPRSDADEATTILLDSLVSRVRAFGRGKSLPAASLGKLFETMPGVRTTTSSADGEDAWRLGVSITDLSDRTVSAGTYGVSPRSDIFHATFLVELRAPSGERKIHRPYEVEVTDFESAKGWKSRGYPPLDVLLDELAEKAYEDLRKTLGL